MADEITSLAGAPLTGMRHLRRVMPLLSRLRPVGCKRDKAGNRKLFFDQYCALFLLYFFNPVLNSLRAIQKATSIKSVQDRINCRRTSLGSLSEAARVFDPALIEPIIAELSAELPSRPYDAQLDQVKQALQAVDGTLLKTLPQITQACYGKRRDGGWRLHTHFEILRGVPVRFTLTDATNSGAASEKAVLRKQLEPDRCYILDRGFEQFSLFNRIHAIGSSYVCCIRADHHFTIEQTKPLSEAARAAGIVEDTVGRLGSPKSQRIEHPDHLLRRVVLKLQPHPKRNGGSGNQALTTLVIATNRLDLPAEVIALIYRHRWMIELFFRFLKHVLRCRHLLLEETQGIQIQCYCALIACLLINLVTGRKPTLRTYEMLCHFFLGVATEDELLAHLSELKNHPG